MRSRSPGLKHLCFFTAPGGLLSMPYLPELGAFSLKSLKSEERLSEPWFWEPWGSMRKRAMSELTKSNFERFAHERYKEKRADEFWEQFQRLNPNNGRKTHKKAWFVHILIKNYAKQRLIVFFFILPSLFHKLCVLELWELNCEQERTNVFWERFSCLGLFNKSKTLVFLRAIERWANLKICKMSDRAIAIHGIKMSGEQIWKKRVSAQVCYLHCIIQRIKTYTHKTWQAPALPSLAGFRRAECGPRACMHSSAGKSPAAPPHKNVVCFTLPSPAPFPAVLYTNRSMPDWSNGPE